MRITCERYRNICYDLIYFSKTKQTNTITFTFSNDSLYAIILVLFILLMKLNIQVIKMGLLVIFRTEIYSVDLT